MSENPTPTLQKPQRKSGLSLDVVWVLVILAGFLFFTSLIPLPPNDFWWHLKAGEYIFTQHAIPATNLYAWTLPADQPFFYASWLAELLFFLLYRLGDLSLVIFMRTLLIGITVWLVAVEARRRSSSWRIAALVIALLGLMVTNNLIVRTQMWAWPLFIGTYLLLQRYVEGEIKWYWLLLCPALMVFWVNVHGSFILGLILPGAYLVGEAARKFLKQGRVLGWRQVGWIAGTGLLSGLAVLVNPHFTGIISYTIKLLTDPPSQMLIEEWQSPTPQGLANIFFFLSILIFIIVLAFSKYRLSITEIILFVGFLWLAWSGQRYVIWYGIISMPILAQLIKDLPIRTPAFQPQKNWLNLALVLVIFIPTLLVQPWFVERLPLPGRYWEQVLRGSSAGPLIGVETPVAAAEYLKSHPGGHLFNEMGYGSYLIWAVPDQGNFIDPRVELFPYNQWMDYIDVNNAVNYDQILQAYGVDRILLDKKLHPKLASALSTDQAWSLEYEDRFAQLWTKSLTP
ncbi:MAG: hypothetical protein C3F13_05265 [Anaerolineales bacterium]|nr:YfhO family protein [Anaerolineae bacterium]PWB55131.1 MAG: hypothetical protein C3F13_05265 [Anaerolineales bacterium]